MEHDPDDPPDGVLFTLGEALDLLADLEDSASALDGSRHVITLLVIEDQIRLLSSKLGFADPEGGSDDR